MMKGDLGAYTVEEFNDRLTTEIKVAVAPASVAPAHPPRAILLGGQSGAGKTALHRVCKQMSDGNAIIINGDEFRSSHPRFQALHRAFGDKSVDYTAPWAGRMTEALVDHLSRVGYNLVVEGTLRTAEVPLKTAELLRQRGYGVSLALMAVKPEISLLSCQIRYEEMRIAGTTPRATDPVRHHKIIDQIVSNLGVLEASGMFDDIFLYSRSQTCLFPRDGVDGTAEAALRTILFGPWSVEERRHCNELKAKLEHLRAK